MDADKLAKIRKQCDDAQGGYSGMRERDYARDVWALLGEYDKLMVVVFDLRNENSRLLELAEQQTEARLKDIEIADVWKRDCLAAQARVAELEQEMQKILDVSQKPNHLYGRPIVKEGGFVMSPEAAKITKDAMEGGK